MLNHYRKVSVLGSGNYGTVYCYEDTNKQPNEIDRYVALKRIPLRPEDPNIRAPNPMLEAESQKRLNHPHIVRLLKGYRDDARHELLLILEYCPGGDLKRFMKTVAPAGNGLHIAIVQRMSAEMISALLHLRRNRTFHRDLKAENILLSSNDPSLAEVKISDFGFAKTIANDVDPLRIVQTACGTPLYMAPERCHNRPYSFESDVWSCGLIVFEMAFGKHLFRRCKALTDLLEAQEDVPELLEQAFDTKPDLREPLQALLLGMLTYDPAKRMSLTDICRSPWLQGLLCYNEDLRVLIHQDHGDQSWLAQAPAMNSPGSTSPQLSPAGGGVTRPGRGGQGDADDILEHSNEVVELAPEIPSAVPSVQPPGYRAMAGHVLLWCRAKMTWMLKPFTQSLAQVGQ